MAKFIELTSQELGDSVLVNIENITCIYPQGCVLMLSGIGGGINGILNITRESMSKLLSVIEEVKEG